MLRNILADLSASMMLTHRGIENRMPEELLSNNNKLHVQVLTIPAKLRILVD